MAERDGISRLGERVAGTELTDRLRHVADSLALDLRDELPPSAVERLVFESADELLRDAVVHDFVPILAARSARERARTAIQLAELD
jgi:hypothetical protein